MGGRKIADNCYEVERSTTLSCNRAKFHEVEFWHQRMGYLNFKDLSKAAKKDFIHGLPKLGKIEKTVCEPCQMGKHIKSHKFHPHSRPLELLHMDLMWPSRTESIGGRKYIIVIVDNFQDIHRSFYSEKSLRPLNMPKSYSRSYKMERATTSREFEVTMSKNSKMQVLQTSMRRTTPSKSFQRPSLNKMKSLKEKSSDEL